MNALKALFALLGLAAGVAVAEMPRAPSAPAPQMTVAALLNLDMDRAARVQRVFDGAREKQRVAREAIGPAVDDTTRLILHAAMEAIRADTEEKLAAILTEEELVKLHAAAPAPTSRLEAMRFRRI